MSIFLNPFNSSPPSTGRTLLTGLVPPTKRRVFVSYHHGNDQAFYNAFSRYYSAAYDVVQDNSLRQSIKSEDWDYIMRKIRENYIAGSSCTIVLCGKETPWRKFVDWETEATLDKDHGLIAVNLPTNPVRPNGNVIVPDRVHDNIQSGYAIWTNWAHLTSNISHLPALIEQANAKPKNLIVNSRPAMSRNQTSPWPT